MGVARCGFATLVAQQNLYIGWGYWLLNGAMAAPCCVFDKLGERVVFQPEIKIAPKSVGIPK